MLVHTKTYYKDTLLPEIKIEKFPVVIFTCSHTNLANIKKLKELYPNNQIISLGDITFLFAKEGELFNNHSIQYFIDSKIPCLFGNHEEIVKDSLDITCEQTTFLKNLPRGFKLIGPDGKYYLLYHNKPEDLWGMDDEKQTANEFRHTYSLIDKNCLSVVRGHYHRNFVIDYPSIGVKLITIGRLSKDGDYLLINENGFEFKKI